MPEGFSLATTAGRLFAKLFGGALNWLRARLKKRDEIHQLSTSLAFGLEHYASQCYDVAHDDGIPGADGCMQIDIPTPKLGLQPSTADLLLLSDKLRYRLAELQARIVRANEFLAYSASEATPPDYGEFFWDRQRQYIKLGVTSLQLAMDMRQYGKLPGDDHASKLLRLANERMEQLAAQETPRQARAAQWQLELSAATARPPTARHGHSTQQGAP